MDLFEFFSHVGRVEDIQLIKDPRTGRSKGLAYVEFTTKDDALKSQVLNGQLVGGYPITIAMPQTEKGSSSSSKKGGPTPSATPPEGLRIYVGSLNFNITEADIRPIFEAFGPLTSVEIHRDTNTGQSKGFGFISFALRADAETAMAALEGVEVGGRPIKIGHASPTENAKNPRPAVSVLPGAPLMVLPHGLGGVTPTNAAAAPPSAPALPPLTTAQLILSSALLVKNMFDPSTETDPEWWKDLEEDVREATPALFVRTPTASAPDAAATPRKSAF